MNLKSLLFKMLLGSWSYKRVFDNGNKGNGILEITKNDLFDLKYSESGVLYLNNGRALNSKRKYYFRLFEKKLEIYFFEGPKSLFQTIKLDQIDKSLIGNAIHLCEEDTYRSRYSFKLDDKTFQIKHIINGPKKSYKSITNYKKIYQ